MCYGRPTLKDRGEEEVRGYRNALRLIHESAAELPVTVATLRQFHKLCRGDIWDAARLKQTDVDIIERYANGRERVQFKPVPAGQPTRQALSRMVALYRQGLRERWLHPLILLAGLNLDFLCIHPFRDGNGRVSRLLLLTCYQLGYEVGRYISLERIIEQNKERYYEALERSSRQWHDGKHDPWPYVNYTQFILKTAYGEFEDRLGQVGTPRGEKSELVRRAVASKTRPFGIADLQRECPGVSTDMIRHVLKALRRAGQVECLGRGQVPTVGERTTPHEALDSTKSGTGRGPPAQQRATTTLPPRVLETIGGPAGQMPSPASRDAAPLGTGSPRGS